MLSFRWTQTTHMYSRLLSMVWYQAKLDQGDGPQWPQKATATKGNRQIFQSDVLLAVRCSTDLFSNSSFPSLFCTNINTLPPTTHGFNCDNSYNKSSPLVKHGCQLSKYLQLRVSAFSTQAEINPVSRTCCWRQKRVQEHGKSHDLYSYSQIKTRKRFYLLN